MQTVVRRTLIFLLLFFVWASASAWADGGAQVPETPELQELLEPEALLDFMQDPPENFFLVDVRTPPEYESGHIPGSINISNTDIGENPPTEDTDAPIVVYCRSGNRSSQAAATLTDLGFSNVLNWGGISRWPYELVTGPDPR